MVDYSTSEKIDEFIVDQTIGRDVQIRVQYQKRDSLSTLLRAFLFLLPDGQPKEPALSPNDEDLAYVATFGDLEVRGAPATASDTHGTSVIISAWHLRLCTRHRRNTGFRRHCDLFKGCKGQSAH